MPHEVVAGTVVVIVNQVSSSKLGSGSSKLDSSSKRGCHSSKLDRSKVILTEEL